MSDYAHPVAFTAATVPYVAHYVLLVMGRDGVEHPERIAKPVIGWAVVTRTEEDGGHGLVNNIEPVVQGEYGEATLTLVHDYANGSTCRLIGVHPEGEAPDEFQAVNAERVLTGEAQRRQRVSQERVRARNGSDLGAMAVRRFLTEGGGGDETA